MYVHGVDKGSNYGTFRAAASGCTDHTPGTPLPFPERPAKDVSTLAMLSPLTAEERRQLALRFRYAAELAGTECANVHTRFEVFNLATLTDAWT